MKKTLWSPWILQKEFSALRVKGLIQDTFLRTISIHGGHVTWPSFLSFATVLIMNVAIYLICTFGFILTFCVCRYYRHGCINRREPAVEGCNEMSCVFRRYIRCVIFTLCSHSCVSVMLNTLATLSNLSTAHTWENCDPEQLITKLTCLWLHKWSRFINICCCGINKLFNFMTNSAQHDMLAPLLYVFKVLYIIAWYTTMSTMYNKSAVFSHIWSWNCSQMKKATFFTAYVTRHGKRAFKSKLSKLIFIVDVLSVWITERILKNINNFLFFEIFNILKLVM